MTEKNNSHQRAVKRMTKYLNAIPVVVVLIINVTVAGYVDYVALMFKLVKVSAIDLSTYLTDVEFG